MLKRKSAAIILSGLIFLTWTGVFADEPAVGQATNAAEAWLRLVDAGFYDRSYADTSSYFKSRISERKWIEKVASVRRPLGAVISRKVQATQYTT